MSTQPSPMSAPGAGFALSTRILAGALMGALAFIGLALSFVVTEPLGTTPRVWVPIAQLVAGVAVHLLLSAMTTSVEPLASSLREEQAQVVARQRWQQAMTVRFAVCESVALLSLGLGFALDQGILLTYLGGAVVSLVLMWLHVWPSARTITRFAERLESEGKHSHLPELFGHRGSGSAIQEL